MRLSIRTKLLLFICGPLVAISAAVLGWDYHQQKSAAIDQMTSLFADKARISAEQLSGRLDNYGQFVASKAAPLAANVPMTSQALIAAAEAPLVEKPHRADLRALEASLVASAIALEPAATGDPVKGTIVRRLPNNLRPSPLSTIVPPGQSAPDWFTAAKESRKPVWTLGFFSGQAARNPICWCAAPILDGDTFRGVFAVAVRAQSFQAVVSPRFRATAAPIDPSRPRERLRDRLLESSATGAPTNSESEADDPSTEPSMEKDAAWTLASPFGPDGFVVLDRDQRIVSSPNVARIGETWLAPTTEAPPDAAQDAWSHMLNDAGGAILVHNLTPRIAGTRPDADHWIAFAQVPSSKLIFATTIPQSLVVRPLVAQLQRSALFSLAGIALIALIIMLVTVRMTRPIEGLAGAVDRLSKGDLDARVENIRSHDELGTLAAGFNDMVAKLKHQIAAVARETAARESIQSELRIARRIQQDLLPHADPALTDRADFALHALNIPARGVAGDFYDYFFVGDALFLVIADVSGKGMPAALLMAVARTVVRDFAGLGLAPAQIAIHANRTIKESSDESMFVTMFLARYEPRTGTLAYVCAGHPPPYILSPSGASLVGGPTAPLLGVFDHDGPDGAIQQAERSLQPGETLFLYTDGVTDARSPGGKSVGDKGLAAALAKLSADNPRSLCERLLSGLQAHEQGAQADDITMLALRRTL